MKFLHFSDLHIGLRLYDRDLSGDQTYILGQILSIAKKEQPDAVLIAGDIYDKAIPSAEAVGIFDRFLTELTAALPDAAVMIISGNHDSAQRMDAYRRILTKQGVHVIGTPPREPGERIEQVTLTDVYGAVHFYLLPFVKPSAVRNAVAGEEEGSLSYDETVRRLIGREAVDTDARNVLLSHQFYLPSGKDADEVERADSEIRTVGNIDSISAEVLNVFDYAALGHIHKPMAVSGVDTYRYSGTPLACSVSEEGQQKSVIIVEMAEKGHTEVRLCPLTPLRSVRTVRGSLSEVLDQASDDYVSVILTDLPGKEDADAQDRIRAAFPYLLEIRREKAEAAYAGSGEAHIRREDPLDVCRAFFPALDEEEESVLLSVIHSVQEVN